MQFRYLAEKPDNPYRLGRHQVPDALPPEKEIVRTAWFRPLKDTDHKRVVPPFNQGQIGSCTANAAIGLLMTEPFHQAAWNFTEDDAVKLYEQETRLDNSQIPGSYPPDDTGSTGAWSMEALKQNGWIRDYVHTRSLHTALRLVVPAPISIGVSWYQSMFTPDKDATIHVDESSGLAGGHQIEVVGLDVAGQRIRIANSWGTEVRKSRAR